ncbi:hypothetical protein HOK021_73570 [Streptomyces hygroscopicus]|nr:hypothetical protein HOK021_73570 [Streptomyces hygroscopicus]
MRFDGEADGAADEVGPQLGVLRGAKGGEVVSDTRDGRSAANLGSPRLQQIATDLVRYW